MARGNRLIFRMAMDTSPDCELHPSGYSDGFARAHLPPFGQWPELVFDATTAAYPARLNAAGELLDRLVVQGVGHRPALIGRESTLTYQQLLARANQLARVIREDWRLPTGSRVLLRGENHPELALAWLAVLKAGCIAVTTMPLLRERELSAIVRKAQVSAALCQHALADELVLTQAACPQLSHVLYLQAPAGHPHGAATQMDKHDTGFDNVDTAQDDVALIAFTSGTTGVPKGTMHFHRDVLTICDVLSRHILDPQPSDVFIGTPPLAFTFGLGGLLLFPLRVGAAAVLVERWSPQTLLEGIERHQATVCFTAPTFYRQMAPLVSARGLPSLRLTVSSGEMLPADTRAAWQRATGLEMTECLGSTEMLHAFIACRPGQVRPGATGRVVPGYQACVLDAQGQPAPAGQIGRLAVKGPTGCRYLEDERQSSYVQNGWNLTGDAYRMDEDGYFWYQSRTDDMIISAGYNIAGPEVEDVLLTHPAVAECGVIGAPSAERGQIVMAFVVLRADAVGNLALADQLKDWVKQRIAPYKYPRSVQFVTHLPRTENAKIQRFKLREWATSLPSGVGPTAV
jgi:2-aminobenzoate-CoA ligase